MQKGGFADPVNAKTGQVYGGVVVNNNALSAAGGLFAAVVAIGAGLTEATKPTGDEGCLLSPTGAPGTLTLTWSPTGAPGTRTLTWPPHRCAWHPDPNPRNQSARPRVTCVTRNGRASNLMCVDHGEESCGMATSSLYAYRIPHPLQSCAYLIPHPPQMATSTAAWLLRHCMLTLYRTHYRWRRVLRHATSMVCLPCTAPTIQMATSTAANPTPTPNPNPNPNHYRRRRVLRCAQRGGELRARPQRRLGLRVDT